MIMPAAAGIIIVPTNIVNIIFFPLNSIVASGYAQREENTTSIIIPPKVMITVFQMYFGRFIYSITPV